MIKGFSLIELMVGLILSSILLMGFTLLGSGIGGQLSYEDAHEKAQKYGNYVLDDMEKSFRLANISDIDSESAGDNFHIVRVEFNDGSEDVKYSIHYQPSDPLHNIAQHEIYKNNKSIHAENETLKHFYNEFENKNYMLTVSQFKCTELGFADQDQVEENDSDKYGPRSADGQQFNSSLYIVDLQLTIHKRIGDDIEEYNQINFQRTVFVSDEYI